MYSGGGWESISWREIEKIPLTLTDDYLREKERETEREKERERQR